MCNKRRVAPLQNPADIHAVLHQKPVNPVVVVQRAPPRPLTPDEGLESAVEPVEELPSALRAAKPPVFRQVFKRRGEGAVEALPQELQRDIDLDWRRLWERCDRPAATTAPGLGEALDDLSPVGIAHDPLKKRLVHLGELLQILFTGMKAPGLTNRRQDLVEDPALKARRFRLIAPKDHPVEAGLGDHGHHLRSTGGAHGASTLFVVLKARRDAVGLGQPQGLANVSENKPGLPIVELHPNIEGAELKALKSSHRSPPALVFTEGATSILARPSNISAAGA